MKVTEEQVTKKIMAELDELGFDIIAFDFPQSGTGVLLHPEKSELPKINLDIIAIKEDKLYLFENKDRYYPKDFTKLSSFKENIIYYSKSIKTKLNLDIDDFKVSTNIGIPKEFEGKVTPTMREKVDKIWSVQC